MAQDFTHFNEQGRAKMVDVGEKPITVRTAVAAASVLVNRETFELIRSGGMKKGDVLTVAQVAGVMGAKHTPGLIPMCHPILIDGIDLSLSLDEERCSVEIRAEVRRVCDEYGTLGHFIPCITYGGPGTVYPNADKFIDDEIDRYNEEHFGFHS